MKYKFQFVFLSFFFWACFLFTSCGPDMLFSEEKTIDNAVWSYADSVDFSFDVADTSIFYNIYLVADYTEAYKNQNLYFKIQTIFPNGKQTEVLRSFDFFDLQGNRLGACSGKTCRLRAFLQENAYFNLPGKYSIVFHQFSRSENLEGIAAVGLEVERGGSRQGKSNKK